MTKTFLQIEPDLIQTLESGETGNTSSLLKKQGGDWVNLSGEIVDLSNEAVQWLDEAAYEAEQVAIAAVAAEQAAKTQGVKYKGFDVSLSEANQNGLSAIMSAENLAIEFDSSIFPIKFKAETADGFKMVELEDFAEFKSFALVFLSARQAFFK